MTRTHQSLVERRLEQRPDLSPDDLSVDHAYLLRKLAAKKATIRALTAKIGRLEQVLKSGGTWQDYERIEACRQMERQAKAENWQ